MTIVTRWILLTPLTAFGITLALLVGQRLSTDALAVVLGIAIGIAAGMPGQWLMFKLLQRCHAPLQPSHPSTLHISTPPTLPGLRSFVVVGEEASELSPRSFNNPDRGLTGIKQKTGAIG